jgi:hypothetical protein
MDAETVSGRQLNERFLDQSRQTGKRRLRYLLGCLTRKAATKNG